MTTEANAVKTFFVSAERLETISNIASDYLSNQQDKPLVQQFITTYYRNLDVRVADKQSDADLAGMALHHFVLLKSYQDNQPVLRLLNPTVEEQHFHSSHSVLQLVAYNRPFLVDTLTMCIEGEGLEVRRIHNTIIDVARDDDGKVIQINEVQDSDSRYFSLVHCEIERTDTETLEALSAVIKAKIATLDTVVGDWQAMQDRLNQIQQDLEHVKVPEVYHSKQEIRDFLQWIAADNFIFLGFREYRIEGAAHQTETAADPDNAKNINLIAVGNSGLGLLNDVSEDTPSRSFAQLPDRLKALMTMPRVVLLSKSSQLSPIHRPVYMDFLGIHKYDAEGHLVGEYRFIGLLTSQAYQLSVQQIPLLREKANKIMERADFPKNGYNYHKYMHIINSLPRDDLFQASIDELYPIVSGIAQLKDKTRLRLFSRVDHYQRFVSCLVYIPRDKFNTNTRLKVQQALVNAFNGTSSGFTTEFNESYHARVHVHVRTEPGQVNSVDLAQLEDELNDLMQDWRDQYQQVMLEALGEQQANLLLKRYLQVIPAAYQERFDVRTAVVDTKRLASLTDSQPMIWKLYQSTGDESNQLHLKLYGQNEPTILSKILPILEDFGVSVISAQTYTFDVADQPLWLQEYQLTQRHTNPINLSVVREQFEDSLSQIWAGRVESDSLNELVLTTRLETFEVVMLRALMRYILQAKAPFSSQYIQQTLVKNSDIAVMIADLFDARMNPEHDSQQRSQKTKACQDQLKAALVNVESLDEDRILRWYLDVINALLRTNYYQRDDEGNRKDRLSFKFAASEIPNLPKPKPMFEIFVYSPRVEAIHLRGGKVARGGLRWSDRMEDFRTEVLGLVKAQMVKNAVIVPVGSKGGFIVKQKTPADGREAFQKEGIACYQTFLRGMLDVTDNLVDGEVVHPNNTVRHDEDDPYLVVAADKGTASFSDIANGVAAEYGFWLDDAFASGGSVGYDHKAMGITARGAWESVKRHFRMLGLDIQNKDDFTVVGIGDMSGDVFGNGMLLSKHIKLQAAFNHLHIFIDPNPDTQASYAERERLFNLPRSTWDDYEKSLISQGGGVFSRADKSITITDEMKQAFDIAEDSLTPNELISRLLTAPVDLIWNGGIGTYVKSGDESHADVGDRANDAVRVNGEDIRAKVFGEGGNLGCTQQGRIEYALYGGPENEGGHLYTDAIDNSGGVNCSDHEVNIKILLGKVVEQGDMTLKQRNELLKSMTDEVAELVLRQNYLQPQALELSHLDGAENLTDHKRIIDYLEAEGRLDRAIEFLPSDEVIEQRRQAGLGMTRPELAVILAYGKMWVYEQLLESDLPDDPYFVNELRKYFPDALVSQFFTEMTRHRLHREIISTYLTNSVVNRLGIEAIFRLFEETNQDVATLIRSYAVVRDLFEVSDNWQILESLDNQVDANSLLQLEVRVRAALEQGIVWLVNAFGSDMQVADTIERFKQGVAELIAPQGIIARQFKAHLEQEVTHFTELGLSAEQAQSFAILPYAIDALDTELLAEQYDRPVAQIASLYFEVYQNLNIDWFMHHVDLLPQQNHWDRRARYALLNELTRSLRQMMNKLLSQSDAAASLKQWQQTHKQATQLMADQMSELKPEQVSLSVLSVMISEMNKLISE
ncbi:NAD-glutamate dehydrogenase [Psychrobacter sp. FDAARGOS_221]|uniref:NAD-glutamate dehydrogenase n=1 Tax=Psychrobacter sp. FDAARGOS_221 TaxID=1975705 RepID=UPI000BB53543|nr:NAD-glutamate dehydrogenase [Psychrobacter sp. FDAARGOS_221]PNK59566.1 NAD-glutamate dehydrogenase [Psychrobacter sp. FDAARGOS_221]